MTPYRAVLILVCLVSFFWGLFVSSYLHYGPWWHFSWWVIATPGVIIICWLGRQATPLTEGEIRTEVEPTLAEVAR